MQSCSPHVFDSSPCSPQQPTFEFLMEALSLLNESDGMMSDLTGFSPELSLEVEAVVNYYDIPHHEMMIRILEHPGDLLPCHLCPSLLALQHTLSSNSYSQKMFAATRKLKGRDNAKVEEQKQAYLRRQHLRDVVHVARLCRRKNVHCVPPIVMMKSIENLFINLNSRAWRRSNRDLDTVSRSFIETLIRNTRRWRERPLFDVSTKYGYGVYDNLEFRLPVAEARIKDGEMIETSILHTTTCKCTL